MTQSIDGNVKNQAGFSIIEILVTLVISSVLFTFALPSFQETVQNNRISTQAGAFISDINLARSEAIKRGLRVTLCKSNDASSCTQSGGWEQGWIIFVDDVAENAIRDANELLLRTHNALSGGNTLVGIDDIDDYISYLPNGFSRTITGAIQTGSLALCDKRENDEQARAIHISATGRPLLSKINDSNQTCHVT